MIWTIVQYDLFSYLFYEQSQLHFTFLERLMTRFSQRTYSKGPINSLREMTIASHFVERIVSLFHTTDKYQREGHSGLNNIVSCINNNRSAGVICIQMQFTRGQIVSENKINLFALNSSRWKFNPYTLV